MDQLCQRITASMQLEPRFHRESVERTTSCASSLALSYANMQPSEGHERSDKSLPSLPSAMEAPPSSIFQRTLRSRSHIVRQYNETALRTMQNSGSLPLPDRRSLKATSSQGQQADNDSLLSRPMSNLDQEQQPDISHDPEVAETSPHSIGDSGIGSDRGSEHLHFMKTTPVATSFELLRAPISEIAVHQHPSRSIPPPEPKPPPAEPKLQPSGRKRHDYGAGTPNLALNNSNVSSASSVTAMPLSARISGSEAAEDELRNLEAPEVVAKDFGLMVSTGPIASSPTSPAGGSDKYLAFRTPSDYAEALFSLSPGMDNIWAPLSRPAMHNRYHGFCKGAWQMRKAVSTLCGVRLLSELFIPVADFVLCKGA